MSTTMMTTSMSARSKKWRSHRSLPSTQGSFFPAKQIIKNLWIGSEGDSKSSSFWKAHNIKFVVNATNNIPIKVPADIQSYRVPIDDHPSENETILKHFPLVVVAMEDVLTHGHGVLVHCRAGMQRSAAVVAAYLMWKRGMTADQVFEFINKKKHETFWPVPTFEKALRAWESQLRAQGRIRR